MMGPARQEQPHLLGCPPALPAGPQSSGLLVLAAGRRTHCPTIVGIRQGHGLLVEHRRHQPRLLIPALVLGRAAPPRPRPPTKAVGMDNGRARPARPRRRRPGSERLPELPHTATGAARRNDLRAATAEPVEPLGGPKAPVQAEPNALPPFRGPAATGLSLPPRRLQRWDGRGLPPQSRLVQNCPLGTRRPSPAFPPSLAAVAPHPGARTALGLHANGPGRAIHIAPQQALGAVLGRRLPLALHVIPGDALEAGDRLGGTRLQGARHGRLLGTPRASKRPLY